MENSSFLFSLFLIAFAYNSLTEIFDDLCRGKIALASGW